MRVLEIAMSKLNIRYDDSLLAKFGEYRRLVLDWNQSVNMTSIIDPDEFEIKHFVDSLLASTYPGYLSGNRIIDVGTGAGFPGIPLALCFPEKQFTLLDSLNKRIKILDEIIIYLGLHNVTAVHGRAEDLAMRKDHREQYDVCLSRAVANLPVLSEYCLPFVRVGGYFGAYKGTNTEEEVKDGQRAIQVLGGQITDQLSIPIEGVSLDHQIIWIEKNRATPAKYPRKAGTPSKEPIL